MPYFRRFRNAKLCAAMKANASTQDAEAGEDVCLGCMWDNESRLETKAKDVNEESPNCTIE
jgi:hypothetical protein